MLGKSIADTSRSPGTGYRVAILIPARDQLHTRFAEHLLRLVQRSTQAGLEVFTFFNTSTIIANQREGLIRQAQEIEADYCFWLDSDMVFPSETLIRMVNQRVDVVACNYHRRTAPHGTVAYVDLSEGWDSYLPMIKEHRLIEVEAVGMGCMLMRTSVFKKLVPPYFEYTLELDTDMWQGEDYTLCEKLREEGTSIYVDLALSTEIGHLGTQEFSYTTLNALK